MSLIFQGVSIFGSRMEDDEIVDELHVAAPKFHFHCHSWAMAERIEVIEHFDLIVTERYTFMVDPLDRVAVVATMEQSVTETEDRNAFR